MTDRPRRPANRLKIALWAVAVVLGWMAPPHPGYCRTGESAVAEDTMLMFVGERLDVLTIASRREESAWQAPAIAEVITREDLRVSGDGTLARALDRTPGFYMAEKEWGVLPYLRGIPNGALILYDTVPMVSDTSKSLNQLGHGTSLAPVKRIEIIRGPGSVLWGPDAFAGIVNVVPLTGRDIDGIETGVTYGEPGSARGGYLNAGGRSGLWDGFLSLSGRWEESEDEDANLVRFWRDEDTAYPFDERLGTGGQREARFLEAFAQIRHDDWLTVSGRMSESRIPYEITRSEEDLTWREMRVIPWSYIKAEANWELDRKSAMRLMGSYSWLEPTFEIIDNTLAQRERTAYGELIYDRSVAAGAGLFTGGLSFREEKIDDAPFWSGALPTFLGEENQSSVPIVTGESYRSELTSLFGQYTHKIGKIDVWGGARYDTYASHRDRVSYSGGISVAPTKQWMAKLLYGTAYRTPYAQQLFLGGDQDMESIKTYTAQLAWRPKSDTELSLVGFRSDIDHHIVNDPYAGTEFSLPNKQSLYGVEVTASATLKKRLRMQSNLTFLENSGPDEQYHYNDYDFIDDDGTVVPHFTNRSYPYNTGARLQGNLMAEWKVTDHTSLTARVRHLGIREHVDVQQGISRDLDDLWLIDAGLVARDLFMPGLDLSLSCRNLTDEDYETSGAFVSIPGSPISFRATVGMAW